MGLLCPGNDNEARKWEIWKLDAYTLSDSCYTTGYSEVNADKDVQEGSLQKNDSILKENVFINTMYQNTTGVILLHLILDR